MLKGIWMLCAAMYGLQRARPEGKKPCKVLETPSEVERNPEEDVRPLDDFKGFLNHPQLQHMLLYQPQPP